MKRKARKRNKKEEYIVQKIEKENSQENQIIQKEWIENECSKINWTNEQRQTKKNLSIKSEK